MVAGNLCEKDRGCLCQTQMIPADPPQDTAKLVAPPRKRILERAKNTTQAEEEKGKKKHE